MQTVTINAHQFEIIHAHYIDYNELAERMGYNIKTQTHYAYQMFNYQLPQYKGMLDTLMRNYKYMLAHCPTGAVMPIICINGQWLVRIECARQLQGRTNKKNARLIYGLNCGTSLIGKEGEAA